jgi:hypothetical protein
MFARPGTIPYAQGKPTNVDFQNPFMEPVEFSLQALFVGAQDISGSMAQQIPEKKWPVGARNRQDLMFPKHMIVYK